MHHPHRGNDLGKTEIKYLREHLTAAEAILSRYDEQSKAADAHE